MPKTFDDLIEKFDQLERELIAAGPAIADEIASSALALSIHRLHTEGIEGRTYSTHQMLATKSQFIRQSAFKATKVEETRFHRDKSGKIKEKKGERKKVVKRTLWIKFPRAQKAVAVMIIPGGYKQFRELQGLQTNHVDVSFTGRTIQNLKILKQQKSEFKFLSIVGATNQEEKEKLKFNVQHYGDFLLPNKKETEALTPIPINRIRAIFSKVLLS